MSTQQRGLYISSTTFSQTQEHQLVCQWHFVRTVTGCSWLWLKGSTGSPRDNMLFIWLPVSVIGMPLARSNSLPRSLWPVVTVLGEPWACLGFYFVGDLLLPRFGPLQLIYNGQEYFNTELNLCRPNIHVTPAL